MLARLLVAGLVTTSITQPVRPRARRPRHSAAIRNTSTCGPAGSARQVPERRRKDSGNTAPLWQPSRGERKAAHDRT
jgi:hypothetical protein